VEDVRTSPVEGSIPFIVSAAAPASAPKAASVRSFVALEASAAADLTLLALGPWRFTKTAAAAPAPATMAAAIASRTIGALSALLIQSAFIQLAFAALAGAFARAVFDGPALFFAARLPGFRFTCLAIIASASPELRVSGLTFDKHQSVIWFNRFDS
jgi:hypothetical protein